MKVTMFKASDGTMFDDAKSLKAHESDAKTTEAVKLVSAEAEASAIRAALNGDHEALSTAIELLGSLCAKRRVASGGAKRTRKPKEGAA